MVSPAKVAELEHGGLWVQQQILGLDVPMTDPKRMDIGQAPEQLVHVQLHTETHTGYDYANSKQQTAISVFIAGFKSGNNHSRINFSPVKYATFYQQMFRRQHLTLPLQTPEPC